MVDTVTTRCPRASPVGARSPCVCGAYFAATVGEQLLSPLFPTAADDLGLSEGQGGIAFGVLALAIAVFNMVSGVGAAAVVGDHRDPVQHGRRPAAGAVVGRDGRRLRQRARRPGAAGRRRRAVLPGRPASRGIVRRARHARLRDGHLRRRVQPRAHRRRAARRARGRRRDGACRSGSPPGSPCAALRRHVADDDRATGARRAGWSLPWRAVLGLPTVVGTVGAILQYGVIPFLTTFAVDEWELSAGRGGDRAHRRPAALDRGQDRRRRQRRPHRRQGERPPHRACCSRRPAWLWVLAPGRHRHLSHRGLFAGTVSSLGPVANVLAVERFGQNGMALGTYRSAADRHRRALAGVVIGNSPSACDRRLPSACSSRCRCCGSAGARAIDRHDRGSDADARARRCAGRRRPPRPRRRSGRARPAAPSCTPIGDVLTTRGAAAGAPRRRRRASRPRSAHRRRRAATPTAVR